MHKTKRDGRKPITKTRKIVNNQKAPHVYISQYLALNTLTDFTFKFVFQIQNFWNYRLRVWPSTIFIFF